MSIPTKQQRCELPRVISAYPPSTSPLRCNLDGRPRLGTASSRSSPSPLLSLGLRGRSPWLRSLLSCDVVAHRLQLSSRIAAAVAFLLLSYSFSVRRFQSVWGASPTRLWQWGEKSPPLEKFGDGGGWTTPGFLPPLQQRQGCE